MHGMLPWQGNEGLPPFNLLVCSRLGRDGGWEEGKRGGAVAGGWLISWLSVMGGLKSGYLSRHQRGLESGCRGGKWLEGVGTGRHWHGQGSSGEGATPTTGRKAHLGRVGARSRTRPEQQWRQHYHHHHPPPRRCSLNWGSFSAPA